MDADDEDKDKYQERRIRHRSHQMYACHHRPSTAPAASLARITTKSNIFIFRHWLTYQSRKIILPQKLLAANKVPRRALLTALASPTQRPIRQGYLLVGMHR